MESPVFKATLSQVKNQAPPRQNKFPKPPGEGRQFPMNVSGPSSRRQVSPAFSTLLCQSDSSLKTHWLPECINLLSTEDSLAFLLWRRGGKKFQVGAGRAPPTCYSSCYIAMQPEQLVLPATNSSQSCTAPKEEWLEILLKYGCLINQGENSFTKIPIVHTDRWLSPPCSPLPTHRAAWEASLFFERSSCIRQPSSETRQKLSEPPVHRRWAPLPPFL